MAAGTKPWLLLLRQGLLLARSPHLVRWRTETFGCYMPSLPGSRAWWRPSGRVMWQLVRQLPSYVRWLAQMQAIRRGGGPGWWHQAYGAGAAEAERWLERAEER